MGPRHRPEKIQVTRSYPTSVRLRNFTFRVQARSKRIAREARKKLSYSLGAASSANLITSNRLTALLMCQPPQQTAPNKINLIHCLNKPADLKCFADGKLNFRLIGLFRQNSTISARPTMCQTIKWQRATPSMSDDVPILLHRYSACHLTTVGGGNFNGR